MGIEVKTDFTNVSLPAEEYYLPFHPGIFDPIFSRRGTQLIFLSLRRCKGRPRYEVGKDAKVLGKFWVMAGTSIFAQAIGRICVLWTLLESPETLPKKFRRDLRFARSWLVGLTNKAASSAYNETLNLKGPAGRCERTSSLQPFWKYNWVAPLPKWTASVIGDFPVSLP